MRKAVLLWCLCLLPLAAAAQTVSDGYWGRFLRSNYRINSINPANAQQTRWNIPAVDTYEYTRFDRYYYEYAKASLSRQSVMAYIELVRTYRFSLYSLAHTDAEAQEAVNTYVTQRDALLASTPLSYKELFVINEYLGRPETPAEMLKTEQTYEEYESIVYNNVSGRLSTEHAKAYLLAAKNLRQSVYKQAADTAELYARMRYVLAQREGFTYPEEMTEEERVSAEEYLSMPVSVNGEGYNLPLNEYMEAFRKALPRAQRKNYPSVHYR